jgi:GTP cyclohydrolase IA
MLARSERSVSYCDLGHPHPMRDMAWPPSADYIEEAFLSLIVAAEGDLRDGTEETPRRAALAWRELMAGYDLDPADVFKTFDGDGYDEIVLLSNVPFHSVCEHHLLPFYGVAHIGYIAEGKIVGLSKLARLLEIYARRLQVQERLATQIVEALEEHLSPVGSICVIEAEHMCMACRGVRKAGIVTTTSVVRGAFRDKDASRAEVMALIRREGP